MEIVHVTFYKPLRTQLENFEGDFNIVVAQLYKNITSALQAVSFLGSPHQNGSAMSLTHVKIL